MRKAIITLNRYAHYFSCLICLALMFLTVSDIGSRIFLKHSITGTFELTQLSLVFIVFLTFGFAQHNKDHVEIDFVYQHIPSKYRKVMSFISIFTYFAIVVLMCWRVFLYGIRMKSAGAITASLKIPHWTIILVGGVGLFFYVLALVSELISLIKGGGLDNDTN